MRLCPVCRTGRRPLCCWPQASCVVKSTSWTFEGFLKVLLFFKKKEWCLSTGNVDKGLALRATRGLSRAGKLYSTIIWKCGNVLALRRTRNDTLWWHTPHNGLSCHPRRHVISFWNSSVIFCSRSEKWTHLSVRKWREMKEKISC